MKLPMGMARLETCGRMFTIGYGWAIVNELVNENSPYYDEEPLMSMTLTIRVSYQDFYVYQAFKYADEAVDDYCGGDGNIVPKLSLNAHFRVDFPIDQGEPHHNIWAQGTLNLINEVNRNSPLNDPLVDGVGIQSHLTVYTTSPSTITSPFHHRLKLLFPPVPQPLHHLPIIIKGTRLVYARLLKHLMR